MHDVVRHDYLTVYVMTWRDFYRACDELIDRLTGLKYSVDTGGSIYQGIYGIPVGGCFVAMRLSQLTGIPIVDNPGNNVIVVDDFIKTGETARCFQKYGVVALFRHKCAPIDIDPGAMVYDGEIQFPWTRLRV
ncbi:MAG TPA: phosphoribosyltransferase [Alphaproteobacteria bacterium]|nr:phosphoribosyltransferase [Alphaproteobacteria bacterium]